VQGLGLGRTVGMRLNVASINIIAIFLTIIIVLQPKKRIMFIHRHGKHPFQL
jgi:hypothetical protein